MKQRDTVFMHKMIAILLNVIYLHVPTKFLVNTSFSFIVMHGQQNVGEGTDIHGCMEGQSDN